MQNIVLYVAAGGTLGVVKDYVNTRNVAAPTLMLGVGCTLKMRLFKGEDIQTAFPLAQLNTVAAWSWIMGDTFGGNAEPLVQADATEITVAQVTDAIDGTTRTYTEVAIPMPDMNTEGLAEWLGEAESKGGLHGELIGTDTGGDIVFVLQVKNFTVRNRIGANGTPTEIEPEYLTEVQVRGLVAGATQQPTARVAYLSTEGRGTLYLDKRNVVDGTAVSGGTLAFAAPTVKTTDGGSTYTGQSGDMFEWLCHVTATADITTITYGAGVDNANVPATLSLKDAATTVHVFRIMATYSAGASNKLAFHIFYDGSYKA